MNNVMQKLGLNVMTCSTVFTLLAVYPSKVYSAVDDAWSYLRALVPRSLQANLRRHGLCQSHKF
jgi:hypothetical protein